MISKTIFRRSCVTPPLSSRRLLRLSQLCFLLIVQMSYTQNNHQALEIDRESHKHVFESLSNRMYLSAENFVNTKFRNLEYRPYSKKKEKKIKITEIIRQILRSCYRVNHITKPSTLKSLDESSNIQFREQNDEDNSLTFSTKPEIWKKDSIIFFPLSSAFEMPPLI